MSIDTVAISPLYTRCGVPDIRAFHTNRRGSGRTGQFGKVGFAAGELSGVTWNVVGVFRAGGTPSGLVIASVPRIVQHSKVGLCSSTNIVAAEALWRLMAEIFIASLVFVVDCRLSFVGFVDSSMFYVGIM